jgi:proline-specific peptidase
VKRAAPIAAFGTLFGGLPRCEPIGAKSPDIVSFSVPLGNLPRYGLPSARARAPSRAGVGYAGDVHRACGILSDPAKEGSMAEIKEVYVPYAGYKTYCKIVGEKTPGKKPLLVLHGGPGDTHNYLLTYAELADRYGRQVIFYDQIGCGKSQIPHQDDSFYTYDLWVNEFYTVREALGLDDIHLFGNSWGGMLGMLCMMKDDTGVNSFVINSSPVRIQTWLDEANRLIKYLPEDMQEALAEAERTGDYDTPAAKAAYDEYYKRHVVGFYEKDYPKMVRDSFDQVGECYMVMQGASEFVVTGKMRDWDIRDQVGSIKVPCMALSGTDDEGTPYTIKQGVDLIPGCKWTLIPGAPHMANITHPDECLKAVEGFISQYD